MIDDIPNVLYHGLTIDQFLEHWQAGSIKGLSRHHLDFEGKRKGTWLSDDFGYIIQNQHGEEVIGKSEVLADWSDLFEEYGIEGDGKIRRDLYKSRIIAELSNLPDPQNAVPHLLSHQLFYFGDIPIACVSVIHMEQVDDQRRAEDINRLIAAAVPEEMIKVYDALIPDSFQTHLQR